MSLQNLKEQHLYSLLPEGIVQVDEKGLIAAFIGGVQDRLEDLRSYAKKYEVFFDTAGIEESNIVVLVTFQTDYGKVVTRTLDVEDDTPIAEGAALTTWAAAQMDVDESLITSCVFGTDLLRYVDINTLQYIAANVGAVLYTSASQPGTEKLNQQRILDSYFPRLKIKGTIQSFDSLGRLMGFDDIRIVPLWGRLSPRLPSDFGSPANNPDFAQAPVYVPRQTLGVEYNPYDMRDGPFFTWTGTVVKDQSSTSSYSQVINDAQPWVKVYITGNITHPAAGAYTLSGGSPHTKASVEPGVGLKFEALGEGAAFNGLELRFSNWNDGTDRLLTIVDRLSTIKYCTSYFDVVATVTDVRAISQFGTLAARKNTDLAADPTLTNDGTAAAPYRPWFSGSASVPFVYRDYTYQIQDGESTPIPGDTRSQATSSQTQYNITPLQKTAVQLVQALDDVRPSTRFPRKVSVGFLNRDSAGYAAYLETSSLGNLIGTIATFGTSVDHITSPYGVEITINGTTLAGEALNGSVMNFSDGYVYSGTYNIQDHTFQFVSSDPTLVATNIYAGWIPTSTEVVRSYSGSYALTAYQHRPEDDNGTASYHDYNGTAVYFYAHGTAIHDEVVDEYPWRESLVNGGALIEITAHPVATISDISMQMVENAVSVKDHSGVEYNLYAVTSTVEPLRMLSAVKDLDTYAPGQLPICYDGGFKSLNDIPDSQRILPGNKSDDFSVYFQATSNLYHAGLAQGVLVADLPGFFGPNMRNGLVGWLPLNEHPDEGDVARDVSSSKTTQTVYGFNLTGSFADRLWDDERGWYLHVTRNGTVATEDHRDIDTCYTLSFWFKPDAVVANSGTSPVLAHGPVRLDFPDDQNALILNVLNVTGTYATVASLPVYSGTFTNVVVGLTGAYVVYGAAPLSETLTVTTTNIGRNFEVFSDAGDGFYISHGSNRDFSIQDVRMWNVLKVPAAIGTLHDCHKTPTMATYWPTSVQVVGNGDMYGLKATPAGFVYPDKMPPGVRFNKLVRIQRYDSMGRYRGEPRYQEVGLGSGTLCQDALPYHLGLAVNTLPATGTMVVSTSHGQMPGFNSLWQSFSGTVPPSMVSTNPCQDRVWIKDESGTNVYEVMLVSSGTAGASLQGTLVETVGNQTRLASVLGYELTVNAYGTVFQTYTGTASDMTPLYLYLNSRTKDDVTNARAVWTAKDDYTLFGNTQSPQIAALDANGILEFENSSALEPGYYRLSITSGNVGKVDEDFDGFSVEISVDDYMIVTRLCANDSGSDFRTTDVIEFKLDQTIASPWFLSVNWLNAYSNPSRGVARKLVIDNYKLEKIQTELYKITLAPTGDQPVVTRLDTSTFSNSVPGGWLATFNSYGTVVQWRHESQVYPANDTVESVVPLSSVMTSNTLDRREDWITNAGSIVIPDSVELPMPVFTSITIS
jgi:hypothetical protein